MLGFWRLPPHLDRNSITENMAMDAPNFSGHTIAVLGGDRREQEIARLAAASGAKVRAYGFPWPGHGIPGVELMPDPQSTINGIRFVLLPIPAAYKDGAVYALAAKEKIYPDEKLLSLMAPRGHIILGLPDEFLIKSAKACAVTLHEYNSDLELMYGRGPTIVEGILEALIKNTEITINRAAIGVLGQGTIGALLTRTLHLLGGRVTVFARNPIQRAAAQAMGVEAVPLDSLGARAPELDIIVSCASSLLVTEAILKRLPRHVVVVDIAATPGTVDFDVAKALGITAVWARGLGNRAPVTAGASQWAGIAQRLEKIIAES